MLASSGSATCSALSTQLDTIVHPWMRRDANIPTTAMRSRERSLSDATPPPRIGVGALERELLSSKPISVASLRIPSTSSIAPSAASSITLSAASPPIIASASLDCGDDGRGDRAALGVNGERAAFRDEDDDEEPGDFGRGDFRPGDLGRGDFPGDFLPFPPSGGGFTPLGDFPPRGE